MTHRMLGVAQLIVMSLVLPFGLASELNSQELVGRITGHVVDEADNVLAGARIFITNQQSARITTAYTDGSGTYLTELGPGIYSVRFEVTGFAGGEVPRVEIRLGRTSILDATLRVGSVTETVVVTAGSMRVVDPDSTIIGRNVTADELDRLPKARSFQSIVSMAPFVNQGQIEGGIQVNGASGAENAFTIDGLSTTSMINGSSRQSTVFDYIQEVQVTTTGLAAEFAGALGGVISAVTKSGSNAFGGEMHYYFAGSRLSAAPVRRLVLNPIDDQAVAHVQDEKPPRVRHEIGGSLSGPLVPDRLFFFGSFTPSFQSTTEKYLFSSGLDESRFTQTLKWIQAFGKLSLGGARTNVDLTALATPVSVVGSLPAPNGFGTNWISSSKRANETNRDRGWRQVQMNATAKADVVVSQAALATFRGGFFHDRYSDSGMPEGTSYAYLTVASAALGLPEILQGPTGIRNAPRALITAFDTTQRTQINADYTHRLDGVGRHTLKAGAGYQHSRNNVKSLYPGGYVDIFWGIPAIVPGQAADRGAYGYYTVNHRGTYGRAGAEVISLYLQDLWHVTNRLGLNLGLRAEDEKVPAYRTDVQKHVLAFGFGERVAPRLGFTYDMSGNGRVKVYGSWGRYVDWTKYDMSRIVFGGEVWCTYYRAIDDPNDAVNANLTSMPGRDLWKGAGSCRDRLVPQFDMLDPNIRPMSQESASAGLDFAAAPRTTVTVRYVRNRLVRTIEDLGALVAGDQKYLIANPGEGLAQTTPATFAPLTPSFPTPKPIRQYDGVELGVSRRLANNWFGNASLTISRLRGNYSGLASSDEIYTAATGLGSATVQQQAGSMFRQGGNLNRAWDSGDQHYDSHGNLDPQGRLATDRPVVLKVYGAYNIARNTQVGAFIYAGSGTPMTTYVNTVHQTQLFVEGRGDMGRTPFYSKTDLLISHELAMAGNKRLRLELNVLNLFNQKTARHIFNNLNRGAGVPDAGAAIDLTNTNLNNGYNYRQMIEGTSKGQNAYDPRYEMADLFEPGTQGQVSVKFLF